MTAGAGPAEKQGVAQAQCPLLPWRKRCPASPWPESAARWAIVVAKIPRTWSACLDKPAAKIVALHQAQDEHGSEPLNTQRQARIAEVLGPEQSDGFASRSLIAKRVALRASRRSSSTGQPPARQQKTLCGNGNTYGQRGHKFQRYEADAVDCAGCALRAQCLRNPHATRGRQVARFEPRVLEAHHRSVRMRSAIDSARGRALYSRRIATVEPVFANIRQHKRMSRFTLRGKTKVATQWQLYCLVHNIEKIATKAMRAG